MLRLPADLAAGSTLVVAVSGGVDSVALLAALAEHGGFRLICWHLDHQLRDGSAADAAFVAALAGRLGVQSVNDRADVRAAMRGDGVEEAARRVRYARLAEFCVQVGAVAACTAHHRDDQAETALMQILRGCGPEGPGGIAADRPLADGVRLLRPLLHATRQDLVEFCRSRQLEWREDPSNADPVFARNRIRHHVLPEWERHCPGIRDALAAMAEHGGAVRRAAASRGAGLIGATCIPVVALQGLDRAALAAVWRELCRRCGVEANRDRLRRLDDLLTGGPGRRLRIGDWLLLRRARQISWTAV